MKKKTDLKQAIFYVICAAVIISNPTTVSASNEQTAVEDTGEQQPSLRQEIQKLKKGNWVNLTTEQKLEDLDILYQTLKDNYPYFHVLKRMRNVDLNEKYTTARKEISKGGTDIVLYKKIYNKVMHKEIAEDLTSQVFLKVVKNYDKYDESKASMMTWLNRIAGNTVIDYFRTNQKEKELLNVEDYEQHLVEEFDWFKKHEKNLLIQTIGRAIKKLKIQEREMLLLKYYKCRSNREIAVIYGLNESTVSSQLFRTMKKLRTCLPED